MEQYIIKGGNPLVGEVEIGGAKNAALAILAAAIMTDETVLIDNLPDVNDINVMLEAISGIGAVVQRLDRHTVKINGGTITDFDIEYDYIHGKAEITHDVDSCNLVLGIDEYLIGEERNSNTEFIQFKKFFQRIYKKTGCKYVDWLKEYEANNIGKYASLEAEDLNVYIFGHSLDVTDKDIMRRLILSEAGRMFKRDGLKAQTTIFHFNQEAMGSQIANLVKVIGQDNLISMVHGSDAKIILQQQQDAI